MTGVQASPFPSNPISGTRAVNADMGMNLDLIVSDRAEICVFHDKPFSKILSWLEYDSRTNRVDFIMEDGDIRNFGIPVEAKLRPYFHNAYVVNIVEMNPTTKKVVGGMELPLIIHAA